MEIDVISLGSFFDQSLSDENERMNKDLSSFNELLSNPFSTYLLPIYKFYKKEEKIDESILSLSKFKELNMNKVKEDMLYYCSSSDILSKLDANNREYLFGESDSEFYNDLSVKSFLDRQNQILYFLKNKDSVKEIVKDIKLGYLMESFKEKTNIISSVENEDLNQVNNILNAIQKAMTILIKEKNNINNKDIPINILNDINTKLKNNRNKIDKVRKEMYIILENNLIMLIALIERIFGKDEGKMIECFNVFLDMINNINSNRLLFMIFQLLYKYKSISNKIKYDTSHKLRGEESIDFEEIINQMNKCNVLIISDLDEFNKSNGYKKNEGNENISDNDIWTVNNKEELFLFTKSKNENNIYFYKINIRKEGENNKIISFCNIELKSNSDEKIIDINITIKNDLIFVCYLIQKELKNDKKDKDQFKFALYFNIYSTSMIQLKEGSIILENLESANLHLYSDQKYIYIISDKDKIFLLKKNYLMNSFKYTKYKINSNIKDVSIDKYRYHNCFNINNYILLENISDKEEGQMVLAEFSKDGDEYILNIANLKGSILENDEKDLIKYKLSYNDNILLMTQIILNSISISIPDFTVNNFIDKGFKFLLFDNTSFSVMDNNRDLNSNSSVYINLLKKYALFVNTYGNFDFLENDKEKLLLSYPYSLCLNININNLNFVIEQVISNDIDYDTKIYYFIIIKEFLCCLYNTNNMKKEQIQKLVEYLKKFILDIVNNNKEIKNRKYINSILKEIVYISSYFKEENIVEIADVKNIINNNELSHKTKLLLIDLLITQPKTQQSLELFELILDFDKFFLTEVFDENKNKDIKIKNKIFSSYFKLYKNVMNKAIILMDVYYHNNNIEKNLLEKIVKNIEGISNSYKNIVDSEICGIPFLFNSTNFNLLYLIIENLLLSESINKDSKIFSSLFNVMSTLDKLNINKNLEKSIDLNNLIEIKNSSIEIEDIDENKEVKNKIIFNGKQNIIFKNNSIIESDPNDYMRLYLIKKEEKDPIQLNLKNLYGNVHYGVDGIEVIFQNNNKIKSQFVLNVLPLKDANEYLKVKNNENNLIINLLQKAILHYFLFLFEKVEVKINDFLKQESVKKFCKLYNTEFLQYIYLNNIDIDMSVFDKKEKKDKKKKDKKENKKEEKDEDKNKDDDEDKDKDEDKEENKEQILYRSNHLINEINKFFYCEEKKESKKKESDLSSIELIFEEFISLFNKLIINDNKNKLNFDTKILAYKDINLVDSSFIKLIEKFKEDISKKNKLLGAIKSNDDINKMILKIFLIIIKYYNYNMKLFNLMSDTKDISANENYKFFYDIYEECCQMKMVYNQEKSRFIDEKFEEQSQDYIKVTMAKIDFIYKIIIPSFDESLKYDKSTVRHLINLIKDKSFSPKEIIKYYEIQNLNCTIKVIELLIISNLLLNLKTEENLKFVLYIINNKYNKNSKVNNYSISMSLLDSLYGANYSKVGQVKNHFHLLIDIIIDNYILNKNNFDKFGITTKISLYQSLLWKYKGRDFNILPKIINCFENLKGSELNTDSNNNDNLFKLEHEKVFRINNYNNNSFNIMKFEIFKIIASQIISKIKDTLNFDNIMEKDNDLKLQRSISKLSDHKLIINSIISYFSSIKKNNPFYHELNLFFYKNFINSPKIIELITTSLSSEVILKIFDIIFDNNTKGNIDNKNILTKLILLKFLLQILDNVNNEDKIANLVDCCMQYDKNSFDNNNSEFNPFIYLITKFKSLLNQEENDYLKYYYFKIILLCVSKIDMNKSNIDIKNILDINLLISSNYNLNLIESKFLIKHEYGNKFEEIALFCPIENNRIEKSGNLLCYIDNDSIFNSYLSDNNITHFNHKDFKYSLQLNKLSERIFTIMDESLDGKINKIKCIEKRDFKDVIIINNKSNNLFYDNYLEKNSSYIYDILINELNQNKLNYKGINYILKLIYNLLGNISVENAEKLIKYIFQYINSEDVINNQKEWDFCSLEYFINDMNYFHTIFDDSNFNLVNENKKEKTEIKDENENEKKLNLEYPLLLSSLFNYTIKNNDLCISYKSNHKIKNNFINALKKVNQIKNMENNNDKINEIKMDNLSFYKAHLLYSFTTITDNSLLLIQKLTVDPELINILDTNKLKIKAIIVQEIDNNTELDEYLKKISVPIYSVSSSLFDKIISFFVEGFGGEYITSNKSEEEKELNIIPIYKPIMLLNNKNNEKFNMDKKEDIKSSFSYLEDDFCLDILFGNKFEGLNDEERNQKLLQYQKDVEKKYEEVTFDLQKVYCLENVKISYRLLYELLTKADILNKINISELDKNIDKILEIFASLCKEYYFNISKKLSVKNVQNLLKKYLKSLNPENSFSKKWLHSFMKSFINDNKENKIKNGKNDSSLDCKEYDNLLFIFRDCSNLLLDEYSINICFDNINDILEKSIIDNGKNEKDKKKDNSIESINNYIYKLNNNKLFKNEFIPYFLYEISNGMYDIITNNKLNSKLLIKCFLNNNFHISIIKFIDHVIQIRNYLQNESNNSLKNNTIPKGKTVLVQFGFKYLDICFYIFFKEKKYDLIDYWIKSNNDLFLFYSSYKMLSTQRHYEEIDYRELLSIIAYVSNAVECFNESQNKKDKKDKLFKMKMNWFNKLNLKNEKNISISSFSFDGLKSDKDKINYKKLAIFAYNKETKNYCLQDIIDTSDTSEMKKNLKDYIQAFNTEEIYLVPMNNISTSLYAFGSNFNHALGINGILAKFYDKPNKCEGLPTNIWNIGYGNNYCLALSEDNQIYACGCNKGGGFNSNPRRIFTNKTRINEVDENSENNKNKYTSFATGNCDSSLLIDENGDLYGIGNNEKKIFGLDDKKLKYPTKLKLNVYKRNNDDKKEEENKIKEKEKIGKIKSIHIGFYNSYIINEEGLLFGIGNNKSFQISEEDIESYSEWKNIPLPTNCVKFLDCAVGENYIICLIQDENGNNRIYAQGNNNFSQCGVYKGQNDDAIHSLTICGNTGNISFKKIYTRNNQSAAITIDGDLYIWGKIRYNNNTEEIYNYPTLVLFDSDNNKKRDNNISDDNENRIIINENIFDNKTIVDEVAISSSHILIIARKYENGSYVRKLFGLGDNSKGALGLPNGENKSESNNSMIKEIPLFNEKKQKLIPIKITIGENKSYILCVNEEDLVQEIKSAEIKDDKEYNINIGNISLDKISQNLLNFYTSKNLDKFINLFRTVSNKVLTEFIDAIDEIKASYKKNSEKEANTSFSIFFDYIKNQHTKELQKIFIQSKSDDKNININQKQELNSLFNYLKSLTRIITNEIFKFCSTNEISEYKAFLQKAIGNNISYLSAEKRLEKFEELLSKKVPKRGTGRRAEVDRFKAKAFYDKFNEDQKNQTPDLEFNKTIFGQVYQTFGKTSGDEFFIQKGKRLFIVCLKNEYASDSGGPYHEVISGICHELQSDYLNMFIKTPNNKHDIGFLRDKYIPNPNATREINEKTYEFLGKIMASAISSGEVLDLNLHPVVWKGLLGNEISFYDYELIDCTYFNLINNLEKELKNYEENTTDLDNFEDVYKLNFVIKNSNEADIELKQDGEKIQVNLHNLKEYISLSKKMRVNEFIKQIEYIKKGFNSVISSSIFQVLNWRQLEELVCGKNKLDVRDLKKNTKYDGYRENDEVIKWFWEWLEECSDHEQSLYLKFVSGRTRLPKEKTFKYEHIIVRSERNNNEALPHSATCFFTLKLPMYKDKETLKKKMKYSILNCDEIDGDH